MMKIINGAEVTAKLSAGLKDIARLTGFSEKDVTRGEAGQILKTWAGRTRPARPDVISYRARKRALHNLGLTSASAPGDITINTGTRAQAGLVWVKTKGLRGKPWKLAGRMNPESFNFIASRYHWKTPDWIDINEAVQDAEIAIKKQTEAAKQAAGLSQQSIIQIADAAGIRLESVSGGGASASAIAKARRALASNGRAYQNGTAVQNEEAGKYALTLIQSLPYWPKIGMDRTLAGVIAGRAGLYRRTFANGAYKSIQSAARNYPWMRTFLAA